MARRWPREPIIPGRASPYRTNISIAPTSIGPGIDLPWHRSALTSICPDIGLPGPDTERPGRDDGLSVIPLPLLRSRCNVSFPSLASAAEGGAGAQRREGEVMA
jgi:hypothetical protein